MRLKNADSAEEPSELDSHERSGHENLGSCVAGGRKSVVTSEDGR
jgi:hypothetical protein